VHRPAELLALLKRVGPLRLDSLTFASDGVLAAAPELSDATFPALRSLTLDHYRYAQPVQPRLSHLEALAVKTAGHGALEAKLDPRALPALKSLVLVGAKLAPALVRPVYDGAFPLERLGLFAWSRPQEVLSALFGAKVFAGLKEVGVDWDLDHQPLEASLGKLGERRILFNPFEDGGELARQLEDLGRFEDAGRCAFTAAQLWDGDDGRPWLEEAKRCFARAAKKDASPELARWQGRVRAALDARQEAS